MYQFSGKLKITAFVLMALGALLTLKSFMDAPSTLEEAKKMIATQNHHYEHDNSHDENSHTKDSHSINDDHNKKSNNNLEKNINDSLSHGSKKLKNNHENEAHLSVNKKNHHAEHHEENHHAEHIFHQMKNRPVAAFYVSLLFFLGITLLVLMFYAAQRVSNAGWPIVLFRVFESIISNMHYVSVIMLIFIILTVLHYTHLFSWMAEGVFDTQSANFDPIIDAKSWWMNIPGWTIRSVFYLLGWNILSYILRKKSLKQDNGDLKLHRQLYNISVGCIVFVMITESMMSWDWIMGVDPHWFSTLFGWYVLSTFLVSALTVVALVTLYLRSKGCLPFVNDSHIHDLVKYMFGLSVFWTYLWFSQFMLIWYSDMPEETTYFLQRFNEFKVPFFGMVFLNFVFPVLLLINSDFKTIPWLVILVGITILIGHYIDLFVMIMPGTVGGQWGIGFGEIGAILFFTGLFIYATFSAFSKVNPLPKGHPFLQESETHHYYIIKHRGEENNSHH